MNPDAFGIRVRFLRTIAPRPPASVSTHVQAVNLDFHKCRRPGEPLLPATVQKPICSRLNLQPQLVFAPWLTSVLGSEKIGLIPCHEHGWKTNRQLWGVHPITNRKTYTPVWSRLRSGAGKIYETTLDVGVD